MAEPTRTRRLGGPRREEKGSSLDEIEPGTASGGPDMGGGLMRPPPDMNTTVAKATFHFDESIHFFLFIVSHLSDGGGRDATLAGLQLCKKPRKFAIQMTVMKI